MHSSCIETTSRGAMDDWENLEPDPAFDYAETQDAFWPVEPPQNDDVDTLLKAGGADHAPINGTWDKQDAVATSIDDGRNASLKVLEAIGTHSAPDSMPQEAATSHDEGVRLKDDGVADQKADASSGHNADAHVCRICFSGEGDEEDDEDLGRLISPCLCKGTVAKVHVACLQAWRTASKGRTSFFQCDQCKYRYRIRRAKIAGLAENNFALAGLAAFFFLILVTVNGYIGNWLLGQSSSPDSVISSLFFGEPDYSSYSGWSSHRDGLFPFEAIGSAVDFASRVAEELQEGNGVQAALTGGQRDGSSYRILGRRSKKTRQRSKTQELALRFRRGVEHVLLGISMTSIGSFLWMLISLPLLPFHPMRTGLFRTVRSTRDSRGQITPMGTILLALFLLVGFLKSLHICWRLTRKVSHVILTRAENGILEVRS